MASISLRFSSASSAPSHFTAWMIARSISAAETSSSSSIRNAPPDRAVTPPRTEPRRPPSPASACDRPALRELAPVSSSSRSSIPRFGAVLRGAERFCRVIRCKGSSSVLRVVPRAPPRNTSSIRSSSPPGTLDLRPVSMRVPRPGAVLRPGAGFAASVPPVVSDDTPFTIATPITTFINVFARLITHPLSSATSW